MHVAAHSPLGIRTRIRVTAPIRNANAISRFLRQLHPEIVARTEAEIAAIGGSVVRDPATGLLRVNDEFSVSLVLVRCQTNESGSHRWKVRFDTSPSPGGSNNEPMYLC